MSPRHSASKHHGITCSSNRERYLEGLKAFLRIPSISTLSQHKGDVRRAAQFVAGELTKMGVNNVELIDAPDRHPLVYGEWLNAKPGAPTLLIYGHYDVQPPDPLNEWVSNPFEPTVRNGNIYARGAVDDKGQVYLLLKAVEELLGWRSMPVNVKFLIEGEEECDGEHIAAYIPAHTTKLAADAVLICDTAMFAPGLPTICTGLRGLLYTEVECQGASHDLHSGMYGGVAPNPFQALCQIVSGLKGRDGRIRIPGFYKSVRKPSRLEEAVWEELPFDPETFLQEMGCSSLSGESRFSVHERLWARPTLEVHGMPGGFTGEGAKTVIPARASAKISMRLVPDMDPSVVEAQYRAYVQKLTPPGVTTTVKILHGAPAMVIDTNNRFISAAAEALTETFGTRTVYTREGGSIPVAGDFARHLKIPVVMFGFGLPDDNLHAPNEKFNLENFYAGIKAVGRFMDILGSQNQV